LAAALERWEPLRLLAYRLAAVRGVSRRRGRSRELPALLLSAASHHRGCAAAALDRDADALGARASGHRVARSFRRRRRLGRGADAPRGIALPAAALADGRSAGDVRGVADAGERRLDASAAGRHRDRAGSRSGPRLAGFPGAGSRPGGRALKARPRASWTPGARARDLIGDRDA